MFNRTLEIARQEIKEVKENNETLLMILDREKRKSDTLKERIKGLESEILETATKYEVKLSLFTFTASISGFIAKDKIVSIL